MATLTIRPPFRATPKQRDFARHWQDPDVNVVTFGGSIRSGKTQAAGRLLLETALRQPCQYLVARSTYRELEDSTKKAMLHGDGSLPPAIPPEAVLQYRASDNLVKLHGGGEILFRSLEANNVGKLLNLTLGGILIDQIEELPLGESGERIIDTLIGRLSDPRGPRKLMAVANPGSTLHWVHRRFVNEETRDPDARYVHVTMRDNEQHLPPGYIERMEATRDSRPHWYRTYVLGEWGAIENAAYPLFEKSVHCLSLSPHIPDGWLRFESMDHGVTNPTAWLVWALDYDGNAVIFDSFYSPKAPMLPSEIAPLILERRAGLWQAQDEDGHPLNHTCFGDPASLRESLPTQNQWGEPLTLQDEYEKHGLKLAPANNRRRAGYVRVAELLKPDPQRAFPRYHERAGETGAPRLYFAPGRCKELVEQVENAPLAMDDNDPERGEAVDKRWESQHGHAHAALRYGALTWFGESKPPEVVEADPRRAAAKRLRSRLHFAADRVVDLT